MTHAPSRICGLIPARGGSKGIPGKNLRLLAGRPLLDYTVDAARRSGVIDLLVVTTDSEAIADRGRALGVDEIIMRPAELARDDTPMLPVVEHALEVLSASEKAVDLVVLLQPTAPLRRPEHIAQAVESLLRQGGDSVASVVQVPAHLSPHYVMRIEGGLLRHVLPQGEHIIRRQDVPAAYYRDGTVYVMWPKTVLVDHSLYGAACHPMVLPSQESITLDTLDDWERAEAALRGS